MKYTSNLSGDKRRMVLVTTEAMALANNLLTYLTVTKYAQQPQPPGYLALSTVRYVGEYKTNSTNHFQAITESPKNEPHRSCFATAQCHS
jgi:hypothetical protein